METVIRAGTVYLVLLVILRFAGRRTLAQATPFDLVLLLIISETVQEAVIDSDDHSMTSAFVAVITLIGINIVLSLLKENWPGFGKLVDGQPMLLVENGRMLESRGRMARVSEEEVMEAARSLHGLRSIDQIKFAVLETNGCVSIIPKASTDKK